MDFKKIKQEITDRANQYSINSESHKTFIEEKSGFDEGVEWTLNKLYQLGYLKVEKDNDEK